jgi:AraC-like DNA-binding protein
LGLRHFAACRKLENTDLCVYDIAIDTGFCDLSHFTKTFKRERGVTPGEYRRQHRSISSVRQPSNKIFPVRMVRRRMQTTHFQRSNP